MFLLKNLYTVFEPGHEKMCLMSYENNKGADQPAHPRSLISAFVVRCLDSIISLDSIAENSRLQLASVAAQAGLCLAWSETPEDTFSRVVDHLYICNHQMPSFHVSFYFFHRNFCFPHPSTILLKTLDELGWMVEFLHPFQQYFSHIGMMEG